MNRRTFFRLTLPALLPIAAAPEGASVTAGCPAVPSEGPDPAETDVIVIGAGAAGLTAAATAAEAGARAVVLEKEPRAGGNTAIGGGYFSVVNPEARRPAGVEDSLSLFYRQTIENGEGKSDPELARLLVTDALPAFTWLQSIGMRFRPDAAPGVARRRKLYPGALGLRGRERRSDSHAPQSGKTPHRPIRPHGGCRIFAPRRQPETDLRKPRRRDRVRRFRREPRYGAGIRAGIFWSRDG